MVQASSINWWQGKANPGTPGGSGCSQCDRLGLVAPGEQFGNTLQAKNGGPDFAEYYNGTSLISGVRRRFQ